MGSSLIPYEKFTLANGLTVVVHTDRKAPIVAVNVWYHVGSKNEVPGKTGFAHLFEHLMFQGSEHYDDEYFKPFEQVGATSMNGTTSFDRTNYFQNVPTTASRRPCTAPVSRQAIHTARYPSARWPTSMSRLSTMCAKVRL